MDDNLENKESTELKFDQDFFDSYNKNCNVLYTLFTEDSTFIGHHNNMSGYSAIQQGMLTMAVTTQLFNIDIISFKMLFPGKVSIYNVLCSSEVEFRNERQIKGSSSTHLIYFLGTNILNFVSFN